MTVKQIKEVPIHFRVNASLMVQSEERDLIELLKDKRVIFFDVGYTLD